MNTVRIHNHDKSQTVLWIKTQKNGLYKVSSSFYDRDGYYDASKSYTFVDVSYEVFEDTIQHAKDRGLKVKMY